MQLIINDTLYRMADEIRKKKFTADKEWLSSQRKKLWELIRQRYCIPNGPKLAVELDGPEAGLVRVRGMNRPYTGFFDNSADTLEDMQLITNIREQALSSRVPESEAESGIGTKATPTPARTIDLFLGV